MQQSDEHLVAEVRELTLEGTASVVSSQQLEAGRYSLVLEECGVDARLALAGLSDGPRATDDPVPRWGKQILHFTVRTPTTLSAEIRGADHERRSATVRLAWYAWPRAAVPDAANPPALAELAHIALMQAGGHGLQSGESGQHAAAALGRAVSFFDEAGRDSDYAEALYALAWLRYLALGEWQQAALDAAAVQRAAGSLGDRALVRRAAVLEAKALLEQAANTSVESGGDTRRELFARAERLLRSAVNEAAASGDVLTQAEAVNDRGIGAFYRGERAAAHSIFTDAARLYREAGDPTGESRALGNLAWIDFERGNARAAATAYERLLDLAEKDTDPRRYAELASNYAVALGQLGEYQRALDLHNELLESFVADGDAAQRARTLQSIGFVYLQLGAFARALETFETAVPLRERLGDGRGTVAALRLAGDAAAALGRLDLALARHQRALQLAGTPRERALLGTSIAADLRRLGRRSEAHTHLEKAWREADEIVRPAALLERGLQQAAAGTPGAAAQALRAAEQGYESLGLDAGRAAAATALAQLLLATGESAGALAAADRAIRIVEDLRLRAANPEARARFLAARYGPYEARIGALLARARPGDTQAAWEALATAERSRGRSLREMLAQDRGARRPDDGERSAAREALVAKQIQLEARLQRFGRDDTQALELRRDIQEIRARLDAAWRLESAASAPATPIAELPPHPEEALRTLPEEKLVLVYFLGEERSWLWTLRHGALSVEQLPPARTVEAAAIRFATALAAVPADGAAIAAAGAAAARVVFGDTLRGAPERELYILPDGSLNRMPFAALPLDAPGRLLIDSHEVTLLPSLSLALGSGEPPRSRSARDLVAVVSDPVFAADDARLGQLALRSEDADRHAETERLTRLPWSAAEARRVVAFAGAGVRILELQGFDATVQGVLALPVDRLRVLHFATHARARSDAPVLSALHLSAFGRDGARIERSRLTLSDVLEARLDADLVVLSGCDTGGGEALRGEGVLGLAQAFLATGSGAVVASLWPIQDTATAAFMGEFYRALGGKNDAARALSVAQRHARTEPRLGATHVWAAFVVQARTFG